MCVGHGQPRLHKQPDRFSGIQAGAADRQPVGAIHLDVLNAQPALKQPGGRRRIGNGKMEILSILCFQFLKAFFFALRLLFSS